MINVFEKKSDISLELPFFMTIQLLLTHLIQKNVAMSIDGIGDKIELDAWVVLLAASGSSKTLTKKTVINALGINDSLIWDTKAVSTAAFIEELCGNGESPSNNRKMLMIDEFSEWFSKVRDSSGPMGDIYRVMLQMHDNESVGRKNTRGEWNCEKPVVSLFGLAPIKTFVDEVPEKDMFSGLMFRLSVVIAERDESRPMSKFPIYKLDLKTSRLKRMLKSISHGEYIVTSTVQKTYNKIFKDVVGKSETDMDAGFLRRVMWRMHKYALAYHIILGDGGKKEISAAAYAWAGRLTERMISDHAVLVHEMAHDLKRAMLKVEKLVEKHGRGISTRDIIAGVREIRTTGEAAAMKKIVLEGR